MSREGRRGSALALFGLALLCASLPAGAWAHDVGLAELHLRETSKGQFVWGWAEGRPTTDLTPRWPQGCRVQGPALHCSERGMVGRLTVSGVGQTHSAVLVHVDWVDGSSRTYTLTAAQSDISFYGGAEDGRGLFDIATAYALLGVEHILTGVDHLAFVASLLLLVGFQRQLALTITAFTLAHSVTLAGNILGWISVRAAPVEVCIALSIVLVASEALRGRATLTSKLPAVVALLFGLVHGAGFAGALRDAGLPEKNVPLALFTFNIGVEIGQLLAVLFAYATTRALARLRWPTRLRTPLLYALGASAAYWSFARMLAIGT